MQYSFTYFRLHLRCVVCQALWWLSGKDMTEDPGLVPGSGRSPGEGNDNPFQYYCLENSMDRGGWWARLVAKIQT